MCTNFRCAFVVMLLPVLLLACQPPASAPTEVAAALPEAPEPGRLKCGLASFVLPEGSIMNIETEPNGGYMKGSIYIAEGQTFELFYSGGQETYPGYAEDASLLAQTERWRDSMKSTMAPDWTPEIRPLKGPHVSGYYCIIQHDPEAQPPNEYVRNEWPKHRFSLRGFVTLNGNVFNLGGAYDDDSGATEALFLDIMKTARWSGP